MITIKKETNEAAIKQFIEAESITVPAENIILMTAHENDSILAQGALVLKKSKIYLDHLILSPEQADNTQLALGLFKALLNFADLRNIKQIYGLNPALKPYYKMLRFTESVEDETTIYSLLLEGYFNCEHT